MKKRRIGGIDGKAVEEVVLQSADAAVSILSYGCVVRDWRIDVGGRSLPMVLGFPEFDAYPEHAKSHGIIAGRVANRISNSEFTLDGRRYRLTANEGPHHLHGGAVGLGRRIWQMESDASAEAVHLRYLSPDGEEGYPGEVAFSVVYRLVGARLVCEMAGVPDRPTPINLAQHSYYNLGGGGDVRDHVFWAAAEEYTPVGADLIPLGRIEPVEGTRMDFREARSFEASDPKQLGLDINLVLDPARDKTTPSALVECPRTGVTAKLWTDEPGLQVFNAAQQRIATPGHERQVYGPFSGLCLEAQHFPDSLHNPDWPSIVRSPKNPYFQSLAVEIAS